MRLIVECRQGSHPAPQGHMFIEVQTISAGGWENFLLPQPDVELDGNGRGKLFVRGESDGLAHLPDGTTVLLSPGTFAVDHG